MYTNFLVFRHHRHKSTATDYTQELFKTAPCDDFIMSLREVKGRFRAKVNADDPQRMARILGGESFDGDEDVARRAICELDKAVPTKVTLLVVDPSFVVSRIDGEHGGVVKRTWIRFKHKQ